jgi:hypothetical protein
MSFFDKNSIWRHRNLGFLVHVTHVTKDGYTLGWANAEDASPMSNYLLGRFWTATQLIHEFTPVPKPGKWDRQIDGESALEEDAEKSSGEV